MRLFKHFKQMLIFFNKEIFGVLLGYLIKFQKTYFQLWTQRFRKIVKINFLVRLLYA